MELQSRPIKANSVAFDQLARTRLWVPTTFALNTAFQWGMTLAGSIQVQDGGAYGAGYFTLTPSVGANLAVANYTDLLLFHRGNAAGRGGFYFKSRINLPVRGNTTGRMFAGLANQTSAFPGGDPSSNTSFHLFGVGKDTGDSNLQIMTNDGSSSVSKTDLGSSFAVYATNRFFDIEFWCAPNASSITYRVTRLDNGAVATGTVSSDLPGSTTMLGPQMWCCNDASANAVDLYYLYVMVEVPPLV